MKTIWKRFTNWVDREEDALKVLLFVSIICWAVLPAALNQARMESGVINADYAPECAPARYNTIEEGEARKILWDLYEEGREKGAKYGPKSYWHYVRTHMELEEKLGRRIAEMNSHYLQRLMFLNLRNGTVPPEEMDESERLTQKEIKKQLNISGENLSWEGFLIGVARIYGKLLLLRLLFMLINFNTEKRLSLKEEITIAPWRLCKFLFFLIPGYPKYQKPAHWIRYKRLEARYLRRKPFGYVLSDEEESMLRQRAQRPIFDFEKVIDLLSFDLSGKITPPERIVKRSLVWAYASMLFVVLLRPLMVAGQGSPKPAFPVPIIIVSSETKLHLPRMDIVKDTLEPKKLGEKRKNDRDDRNNREDGEKAVVSDNNLLPPLAPSDRIEEHAPSPFQSPVQEIEHIPRMAA